MRRCFRGLAAQVQTALEQQPYSGHVFIYRGRRGDMVKLLWFDGDGLCLFQKRLERGRFVWPQASSGTVSLRRAQLSMLLEGIDWRAPLRTAERFKHAERVLQGMAGWELPQADDAKAKASKAAETHDKSKRGQRNKSR